MHKKTALFIFLLSCGLLFSCGNKSDQKESTGDVVESSGKYPDAVAAMKKMINAQEKYIKDIQNVKTAEDVVNAMNTYMDAYSAIASEIENISTKYPELADDSVSDAEIEALTKRMEDLSEKTSTESAAKLIKFMNDPDVQNAIKDLADKMGSSEM